MNRKNCMAVCLMAIFVTAPLHASAEELPTSSGDYLNTLSCGIATLLNPSSYNSEQTKQAAEELEQYASQTDSVEPENDDSSLFMANVTYSVNVREEADENSEKAGLLYKDCGGRILERGDEWSRIQSGDLVGWVNNEYILFDEEAEQLASEVGFKVLTVETDALWVREAPNEDAEVLEVVADGDELDVVDDTDNEWIEVDYEGDSGFVQAEYVEETFKIDAGETVEAIKKREEEEAEAARKAAAAKLKQKQAAVIADGNDVRLLAALIQCEAGVSNYDGQLAVGAVVMNRVRSGGYPNTISGVIYASGQFTPALNGKVANVYAGKVYDSCMKAAQAAINGETNVGTATHFKRVGAHDGTVIGGQVFW